MMLLKTPHSHSAQTAGIQNFPTVLVQNAVITKAVK